MILDNAAGRDARSQARARRWLCLIGADRRRTRRGLPAACPPGGAGHRWPARGPAPARRQSLRAFGQPGAAPPACPRARRRALPAAATSRTERPSTVTAVMTSRAFDIPAASSPQPG